MNSVSPPTKSKMMPLPVEIWHAITTWLGPFDTLNTSRTLRNARGALTRQQLENSRFWTSIFEDDIWINNVLSCGLQPAVFRCDHKEDGDAYMILVLAGNMAQVADGMKHSDKLLPSLRSGSFSDETLEVIFQDFTLTVCNILEPGIVIDVPDPARLFRDESGKARTSVIHYDTTSNVHTIDVTLASKECVVLNLRYLQCQYLWAFRRRRFKPGLRRLLNS